MLRIHWRFRFVKTIFCIFLKVFTLITKVGIFFSHLQFMMLLHLVWMCLSVCVFVDKTNQRTRSLTLFCQDFVLVYRRICLEWIQSGCLDMAVCGCETVVKAVSCLSAAFLPSIHIFFHNPSPPLPSTSDYYSSNNSKQTKYSSFQLYIHGQRYEIWTRCGSSPSVLRH